MGIKKALEAIHDIPAGMEAASYFDVRQGLRNVLQAFAEPDEGEPRTGRIFIGKKFDGDVWVKFDDVKSGFVDSQVVYSTPPDQPLQFGDLVKQTKNSSLGIITKVEENSVHVLHCSFDDSEILKWGVWYKGDIELIERNAHKYYFSQIYQRLTGDC